MSLWIKICGITRSDALEAALEAGVQALGFVFADGSPRRVTPQQARTLCASLPEGVQRVAVTRHPACAQWREVWEGFRPDVLQSDAQDYAALDLAEGCTALPVYRDVDRPDPDSGEWPEWLLYEGAVSGSGRQPDWDLAARLARRTRLVLAGGLHPDNVAEAVRRVRPFGVDVSSGVESARGVKDPQRIRAFVAAAREAAT